MNSPDAASTHLLIRAVEDADIEAFFEHQRDPQANVMANFPAREHEAFVTHWAKIKADETVEVRTIDLDGRVVGNVVSWEQSDMRLVGYWIGRRDWGRGIATAALTLFLGEVTSRPLHAYVAAHNLASIRVLEKCGFRLVPAQNDHATATDPAEVDEHLLVLTSANGYITD
jgi:RimJ/RimL family protein N-acetyltransferase